MLVSTVKWQCHLPLYSYIVSEAPHVLISGYGSECPTMSRWSFGLEAWGWINSWTAITGTGYSRTPMPGAKRLITVAVAVGILGEIATHAE